MLDDFKSRIKDLRKKADLTQKQFAEKANISVVSYSSYEQGGKLPPLEIAAKIAATFNVSLDWLCGLNTEKSDGAPKSVGDVIEMFINMSLTTMYFELQEEKIPYDLAQTLPKQYHRFANADSEGVQYVNQAALRCADPDLSTFFHGWSSMYKMYKSGVMDTETYLHWARKEINKYANSALDLVERM